MRSGRGHCWEHPCLDQPSVLAPAAASWPGVGSKELFPLPGAEVWVPQSPCGHGAVSWVHAPTRTRVGRAKLIRWQSHVSVPLFLMVGSCGASPLSLSMAGGCRCHPKPGTRRPRVLPNTQGPRWAFKITIYYSGAFQAKIPSQGPGVGFWGGRLGVGVDLGFFWFFFALSFLSFFKKKQGEKFRGGKERAPVPSCSPN